MVGEGAKYIEMNQDHWETIFQIYQLKCLNKCTISGWGGVGGFQKKGAQAYAISGSFRSCT